jgi:hypothetical protein
MASIRIIDPSDLVLDEKGNVIEVHGDDGTLYTQGCALLDALVLWDKEKRLADAAVGPKEMLELVEHLVDFTYKEDNMRHAIEHLGIWCEVMRSALPHVTRSGMSF